MSWIRGNVRTQVHQCGFASVNSVACTPGEQDLVMGLSGEVVERLRCIVAEYLGVSGELGTLPLVCIGGSLRACELPRRLRAFYQTSAGVYDHASQAAFVFMHAIQCQTRFRQIAVHELTHALLGVLSDEFEFPSVLNEGLCVAMERRLVFERAMLLRRDWPRGPLPRATPDVPTEFPTSVWRLLRVRYGRSRLSPGLMTAGYGLLTFLAAVNYVFPCLRGLFRELLAERVTKPRKVYRHLCSRVGTDRVTLEAAFARFSATGEFNSEVRLYRDLIQRIA